MKTSVQQIMIGTISNKYEEALNTLNSIKSFGYDEIEINSFMIHPTSFLVKMLTKLAGMPTGNGGKLDWFSLIKNSDLKVSAYHSDLGTLKRNINQVITEANQLETKYIVVTGMYRFDYSNIEKLEELCNDLNEIGKVLKENNLSLLYHNHNVEFIKIGSQMVYNYMIEHLNKDYVNFELDIYWAIEAGVNPLELMDRLTNRIKLIHINDKTSTSKGPFVTPILKYDACELNFGSINLDAIINKAKIIGVDTIILEQHKNFIDKSPLKSIEISGQYLNLKK